MTKKVSRNTKLYFLVIAITIAIFSIVILSQSHFASSLNINSKSRAVSKTLFPSCLAPISISQDRYPLALYGSNLLYSNLININGTFYPEPDKIFVWNVGPDLKPNTPDDLNPVQINAPGIVLMGIGGDYGDISPKISNRYIVWASYDGNFYNINVIDMGFDGILNSTEASNARVIHTAPYTGMRANSISLKGSKVAFTYLDPRGFSTISLETGFCDLSIGSGQGSCSQNEVIVFVPRNYDTFKMTGDTYFYYDTNLGEYQVLLGERTYLDPQNGLVDYSINSWSQSSGVNLISNQTKLIDLYESLATVYYQDKIYGYLYPGSIPSNLIRISRGPNDGSATINVRNDISPSGNYLTAYTKTFAYVNASSGTLNEFQYLYLGSLSNGLELKTPFGFIEKPLLDSSSSGNYLYVHEFSGSRYDLYFSECFGI